MVPDYINNFLNIIRNGSKVNSYKLVWAKAIVEICYLNPNLDKITLLEISKKILKYYWNQTIYFDLIQGNNPNKRPEFLTEVRNYIESYYSLNYTKIPIRFERIESKIQINHSKLVSILKKDVSWRFLKYQNQSLAIYKYTKGDDFISELQPKLIKEYAEILNESINFKWTQILENFNNVPRIAKKVRVMDLDGIKRKSLSNFKKYLFVENPQQKCFICDKHINNDLSIDHVIPWSFMFSDDIWNLVLVHASCNSSKSNNIPNEVDVQKLEKRNLNLYHQLSMHTELKTKKTYRELEFAIEKDYVRKFWIQCKI